jgi:putative OPT family oligopeptide transporter
MSNAAPTELNKPFIPADKTLPELTVRAIILGIVLAILLAASNVYLGLKAGTTISASIPAAIISMGILRFFRDSNILENNIVQTAASAGEALVAGMAYIIPALLILNYWNTFNYLDCVLLGIAGGGIGVIYSIPIRRVMLSNPHLSFPEGVAIGNVLKASADRSLGIKYLLQGGFVGSVVGFAQDGLQVLSDSFIKWGFFAGNVLGYGVGFSPALLAAGYIVGFEVCASVFIGTLVGWFLGIGVLSHLYNHGLSAADFVTQVGHVQLRYIGLGVMLLGGVVTIIKLIRPMVRGFRDIIAEKKALGDKPAEVLRTDKNLSFKQILFGFTFFSLIAFFVLRNHVFISFHFNMLHSIAIAFFLLIFVLIVGFILSCLCAYFSGLVGSTNNPVSAMVLACVIFCSFTLIVLLGAQLGVAGTNIAAAALVIIASTLVSNSVNLTAETIQDLKAGQMVGATPWKQQAMLIVGVLISALVVPLVLKLLFEAYGMGGVYPHPGMDPRQSLSAPQSAMMAAVVMAVFSHNLPWNLLLSGFIIAAVCLLLNWLFRARKLNIIIMAVGLGIYIPLDATTSMVLGGIVSLLVYRFNQRAKKDGATPAKEASDLVRYQKGLMLACGMVAGCALMGVVLAIPFAISQSTNVLALVSEKFAPIANVLSVVMTLGVMTWLYRVSTRNT